LGSAVEYQEAQQPEVEPPETQQPEVEYQETQQPEVEHQETQQPEVEHQETQQPEVEYQEAQPTEMIQALNSLKLAVDKRDLRPEDFSYLKKELKELAALLSSSQH